VRRLITLLSRDARYRVRVQPPRRRLAPLVAALIGLSAAVGAARPLAVRASTPLPAAPGCPMFPADNVWNTDISNLPVHPQSGAWIGSSGGSQQRLHPDFGPSGGSMPYGIPFQVVPDSHQKVAVSFTYAGESDPGPYPLGPDTPIEGGASSTGDRHALVVDRDTCKLYETFDTHYSPSGSTAGSGAIFDLQSSQLRPSGWTSADAAGLPMLPGLLRRDEVLSGSVTHAIRMTVQRTDRSFLWPARHQAGAASDPSLPPMGARFRMGAGVDISGFSPQAQVILTAMKHYGLIVADNGSNWYFGGAAEEGWDTAVLDELKTIPAGDFDAVDESSLMIDANSAQARQPGPPPPPPPSGSRGYWLVAGDGGVFTFGSAPFYGSMGGTPLNRPVVGIARTADGGGYWEVASDGGIFSFGDAGFYGSEGARPLNRPIVGMAATPSGRGYWLVASDGGIFSFGDAGFYGSEGARPLNKPIAGMAATPSGRGYWLVASDGGIFAFGDAGFYGSEGARPLNRPIVGVSASSSGGGYWLAAADGGVFAHGDAPFRGSAGSLPLVSPVVAVAGSPLGGYWLAAGDGGMFSYGVPFLGSMGGHPLNRPIVAMTAIG